MSHFDFHNHPEDSDELAHWATSSGHFDEDDSGYTVTITDLHKITHKSIQLTLKAMAYYYTQFSAKPHTFFSRKKNVVDLYFNFREIFTR